MNKRACDDAYARKKAQREAELTLVEGVVGVRLEEQVLQADHHSVQVQDWLPVLAKNVQTDVSIEVEVGVVDLRG